MSKGVGPRGLNKEGLYNGVKPPEEGDRKIWRKNIEEESL